MQILQLSYTHTNADLRRCANSTICECTFGCMLMSATNNCCHIYQNLYIYACNIFMYTCMQYIHRQPYYQRNCYALQVLFHSHSCCSCCGIKVRSYKMLQHLNCHKLCCTKQLAGKVEGGAK